MSTAIYHPFQKFFELFKPFRVKENPNAPGMIDPADIQFLQFGRSTVGSLDFNRYRNPVHTTYKVRYAGLLKTTAPNFGVPSKP